VGAIYADLYDATVRAWEVGQRLIAIREDMPHGLWLKWLELNCPSLNRKTAYRWINFAESYPLKGSMQKVARLGVGGAMRLLAPPAPKEEADGPPETPVSVLNDQLRRALGQLSRTTLTAEDKRAIIHSIESFLTALQRRWGT
jgi:Protein of unknown function (DUF3102)